MGRGVGKSWAERKQIILLAEFAVPIFLITYGILVQTGLVPGSQFFSITAYFGTVAFAVGLSFIQFFMQTESPNGMFTRLCGYHLLAAAYFILVSGIYTPLSALWVVLMLAAYMYSGLRGLILNIVSITVIVAVNAIITQPFDLALALTNLLLLGILATIGMIVIFIVRSHETDQLALAKSRQQENIQRERTLTLVNNLSDAIFSTDAHGIIKIYNAAALNLLDTNDSLNGKNIDDVVKLHNQDGEAIVITNELSASTSVTVRDDTSMNYDDGESTRLELTYSPIRGSFKGKRKTHDGYIIIMRDITKSKSLEEERDEFISVVSHELRTPITIAEGAISNAQLLIQRGDAQPDKIKSIVDMAHEQVIFLARMVNDLSTLSRAERGIADGAEDIDVKELVYTIYNNYTEQAKAKGLHFNLDTHGKLGKVQVSRLYLEELIQNFITNAIKYTIKGEIVFSVKQVGDSVTFTVKDTGIGISKSDQKKIFKKFFRAEDYRTRETSGTGLGLYVAAKLSKKLDTTIELTSRLNHGSTFSFTLPLSK